LQLRLFGLGQATIARPVQSCSLATAAQAVPGAPGDGRIGQRRFV